MDFVAALRRIGDHLDAADADWAVIGGLALAVRGAGRLTHDVDIITERSARNDFIAFLESRGYSTLHASEGYSNHAHSDPKLGRIDVVYIDAATAQKLFAEATEEEIFPGVNARVPRAEHLIAMKVLAARNDRTRRLQEMADIAGLMRSCGIAPRDVRHYFARHDMIDAWNEIDESF